MTTIRKCSNMSFWAVTFPSIVSSSRSLKVVVLKRLVLGWSPPVQVEKKPFHLVHVAFA